MVLLLDNFDSFTYNLVDYFGQLGIECKVLRNNTPLEEIRKYSYTGVILSPGPERPSKAGNLMEVLAYYIGKLPILGICLGHQAIGVHFGCDLVKAQKPMHGKVSLLICDTEQRLFKGLPTSFNIVRYHSLVLENITKDIRVTARTKQGEIMAIAHTKYPIHGMQFHPEAALTEFGLEMLNNWAITYNLS